jgi:hypothetical protein
MELRNSSSVLMRVQCKIPSVEASLRVQPQAKEIRSHEAIECVLESPDSVCEFRVEAVCNVPALEHSSHSFILCPCPITNDP